MSYSLEHEKARLNRQIEMIKNQVQRIQVDKEELGERTKQMQRQFKTKEQFWMYLGNFGKKSGKILRRRRRKWKLYSKRSNWT